MFNTGSEFIGGDFQELLQSYCIKAVPTTVRNTKNKGVIECAHLTVGDMLCTMTSSGDDWFQEMQRALGAVPWAIRTTINPNIKHSPCHLAFNQDMIFRWAVTVNWEEINKECQKLTAALNKKENQSRLPKEYSPGDKILIILYADEQRSQPGMNTPTRGLFTITQVNNMNGTVKISRGNRAETINIRRIKPFYS
jgi:leucyl aminopeptidase (aminopeptidase T)